MLSELAEIIEGQVVFAESDKPAAGVTIAFRVRTAPKKRSRSATQIDRSCSCATRRPLPRHRLPEGSFSAGVSFANRSDGPRDRIARGASRSKARP